MRIRPKDKVTITITAGVILVAAAIILFVGFLLKGEVKVAGDLPDAEVSEALSCTAENIDYPFFEYDNAVKKTTAVNVIFNGEKVASISLMQKMYYGDEKSAQISATLNHTAMNKAFGAELGADALGANYDVTGNVMRLSLYMSGGEFEVGARKFFLIKTSLSGVEGYVNYYTEQGFECVEKNNEK